MKTNIRVATDILRRLGEELNPSPDQGIVELVKNSYDADARNCTIKLVNIDKPGGTIRLVDDGDGMDSDDIVNGWLVLGRSQKSIGSTRLGRIPAGSKGLGRLAALRLGTKVILITRPRAYPNKQYRLVIDWTVYENARIVEDVPLQVDEEEAPTKSTSGTEIRIENLHDSISRMDVKRLARSLILLADPFTDSPEAFNPVLLSTEFKDLSHLVKRRYFDDAEYHLVASVGQEGKARAIVTDYRGKKLFSATHEDINPSAPQRVYNCPPVQFDFWIYILDKATFSARSSTLLEVREWLKSFGGVHLYQNGLRVSPYGNPGNDWLDINLARARSPEERPSTNTSIGRVSVHDMESLLVQKTDRSGFIETLAFQELRFAIQDILEWLAAKRLKEAEKRRRVEKKKVKSRSQQAKKSVNEVIEQVPEQVRDDIKKAFVVYERARDDEVTTLQKEVLLYRTLSTAGITAATFAHESAGNPLKVIGQAAKLLERRGRQSLGEKYSETLQQPVDIILHSADALKVLGNVTLSLVEQEKRRTRRVDIQTTIKNVIAMFRPFTDERNITVILELAPGNPYLRGSEAAVESIFTNLLNNSIFWLEKASAEKLKIIVRTQKTDGILVITFTDNGPGIQGLDKEDIWLPGKSTRPNGTGLGLTIVRDAVDDLGGQVGVEEHGELGGAEITVRLPILGG